MLPKVWIGWNGQTMFDSMDACIDTRLSRILDLDPGPDPVFFNHRDPDAVLAILTFGH